MPEIFRGARWIGVVHPKYLTQFSEERLEVALFVGTGPEPLFNELLDASRGHQLRLERVAKNKGLLVKI